MKASKEKSSIGSIVFAMSFYICVSISLVFANKTVLGGEKLNAPLFLTWTQLVVAVLCCLLLANPENPIALIIK